MVYPQKELSHLLFFLKKKINKIKNKKNKKKINKINYAKYLYRLFMVLSNLNWMLILLSDDQLIIICDAI